MLKPLRAFVAIVAVACSTAPAAFAGFEADERQPYREFFDPDNPVKGEALLGLSIVPPSAEAQLADEISVWFGEHYEGPVTVETLAADGAFRGVGTFVGATDDVGWAKLPLQPQSDPGKARPANPVGLAVAVRGAAPNEFRIAHWGEPPEASDDDLVLRLYVNSRRADMSVRAGDVVVPCKPVEMIRPLRFDAYCDLPMSDLPPTNAVDLIRRDGFHIEAQPIRILR